MISIVIPTRNGATTLPAVLSAIAAQQIDDVVEIIAIDSSSSDGTVALLEKGSARVIPIAPPEFNHGLSRNRAVAEARGDLVVLMVQDAVPASDRWLRELTQPFDDDPRLAGTFARQIARGDASAIARQYLASWLASSEIPRTAELSGLDEFRRLSPIDRFTRCIFDNVCSCIRRSVWNAHPFRETPIAEDLRWAKDVLLAGYRLKFVPNAAVVHSHDRTPVYEYARTRALHEQLYRLFEMQTIPTVGALARAIGSSFRLHLALGGRGRGAALAVAWPLGQYQGARDAIHQRPHRRADGV